MQLIFAIESFENDELVCSSEFTIITVADLRLLYYEDIRFRNC